MKKLFVSSSGTGIGKTLVSAALIHQLRTSDRTVRVLKPVISGYTPDTHHESDTGILLDSLGADHDETAIGLVSPYRFEAPLSPDMAAVREGTSIDYDALLDVCRNAETGGEDVLLIEGVGGVMVPLTEDRTVLDWMAALNHPCVLVVGSYLGTISHTLTAIEALRLREIPLAAVVISESEESPVPPEETRAAIRRFAPGVEIAIVPRLTGSQPWRHAPDLTFLAEN